MLARERLIEIAVAVGCVGLMVLTLYVLGQTYVVENGQPYLESPGGEYVVYSVVGFILLLSVAGIAVLRLVTVVEAEGDDGDDGFST